MEVAEVRVKYKPGKREYNWFLKSCEFCAVPWYVKIYVESWAWETNKQKGERIKEGDSFIILQWFRCVMKMAGTGQVKCELMKGVDKRETAEIT